MTTSIDQSGTEKALHRVLHIVKFMRAMVLYSVFAAFFVTVSALGWTIRLPMFSTAGDQLREILTDDGGGPGAAALVVGCLLAVSLMSWFYAAIVSVRRRSLKALALL